MSFTVGLGGKGKVTNAATVWAVTIVRSHMADERALVSAGVVT
jgi:hypothetical protein